MRRAFAPSAPYSRRAPSPPSLDVRYPLMGRRAGSEAQFVLVPSYDNADPGRLTAQDISIITGNAPRLIAYNKSTDWRYEDRRKAQRVLEFLYIGPVTAIRDLQFLKDEGITMVLVVRNTRLPSRSLDLAVEQLGIVGQYVEIPGAQHFIQSLPDIISTVNNHLIHIFHSQGHKRTTDGEMVVDSTNMARGKVFVACESGNELSPAIAAAYIMAIYGNSFESAIQFVGIQRFCVSIDAGLKQLLCTWGGILSARAMVARYQSRASQDRANGTVKPAKRGIQDTLDGDDGALDDGKSSMQDSDRFSGREAFVPFHDLDLEN